MNHDRSANAAASRYWLEAMMRDVLFCLSRRNADEKHWWQTTIYNSPVELPINIRWREEYFKIPVSIQKSFGRKRGGRKEEKLSP